MNLTSRLCVAACLLLMVGIASAQSGGSVDDALHLPGTNPVLQQNRQQENGDSYLQKPGKNSQQPSLHENELKGKQLPQSTVTFLLRDVEFTYSVFISKKELDALASDYVGRYVTVNDINMLLGDINAVYKRLGIFTAIAVVPPQKVEHGVLRIQLIEGRLGKVEVSGNKRMPAAFFKKRVDVAQGAIVDVRGLRDSLQLINHTGLASVQAHLNAGDKPGDTNLLLQVNEPHVVQLQTFVDNMGNESTGRYEAGVAGQVYGLLKRDDILTLQVVGSQKRGTFNGYADYDFAVGEQGGRLKVSHMQGGINVIDGDFQTLDITGISRQSSLRFSQPVFHQNDFWIDAFLNQSHSESSTDVSDVLLSQYGVWRSDAGVVFSGMGDGYSWNMQQAASYANVSDVADKHNVYAIFVGGAGLNVKLADKWAGSLRSGWQYAPKRDLPSPVLFQVGGSSTVRGYEPGALSGSRGYFGSLQVQYKFEDFSPFVFVDHGSVTASEIGQNHISSAGVGFQWLFHKALLTNVSWGYQLHPVDDGRRPSIVYARISYAWPGY